MTDRAQVNIKIWSVKKDKWEDHIEDNAEYSSMTDLIRQSVSKEIAGSHDQDPKMAAESGKEVAEMKDMITSLQGDIDTLSSVVSDLQRTVKTEPSDKHLRSEIFAALPAEDSMKGPVSAEELAEELGPVDEQVVSKVLENLADDVSAVEKGFEGDQILYRKKV